MAVTASAAKAAVDVSDRAMYARSAPTMARKREHEPVALHRGMAYLRPYSASLTPNIESKEVTNSSTCDPGGKRHPMGERREVGTAAEDTQKRGMQVEVSGCGVREKD